MKKELANCTCVIESQRQSWPAESWLGTVGQIPLGTALLGLGYTSLSSHTLYEVLPLLPQVAPRCLCDLALVLLSWGGTTCQESYTCLAAVDWNMNLQCGGLRGACVALDSQATVVKQAIFFGCSWRVMCDLF